MASGSLELTPMWGADQCLVIRGLGNTSSDAEDDHAVTPYTAKPACPADGCKVQRVLYKHVHHFRCPACRMVYASISDRVGEARGRISLRYLEYLEEGSPADDCRMQVNPGAGGQAGDARPAARAMKPQYLAHLSVLAVSHWGAKNADDHGMVLSVLEEMAAQGLAEPVGGNWIATSEGQRAFLTKAKGRA
jgi:hypothetical protein